MNPPTLESPMTIARVVSRLHTAFDRDECNPEWADSLAALQIAINAGDDGQ